MNIKKLTAGICCAALALGCLAGCSSESGAASVDGAAAAADYPSKEIQCIVPQNAGGGTDALARAVCTPLEEIIGKPIVIVNNGSASGLVGTENIANADPDGYTLGVFSNTDVADFVYGDKGAEFDVDSFTYIAGLNSTGDILLLKKDSELKTLDDFIAYAKENPGKMTIGLPSAIQNLSLDLMNQALGIETTGVVYEGGNKVFADILGGHIDAAILSAKFIAQAEEQDITVLGLMLAERLNTFPDTPTFTEQDYDIVNPAVRMLVGPKGIPQEIVDIIVADLEEGYEGAIADGLLTIGEEPALLTGDDLAAFLEEDYAMREEMLK